MDGAVTAGGGSNNKHATYSMLLTVCGWFCLHLCRTYVLTCSLACLDCPPRVRVVMFHLSGWQDVQGRGAARVRGTRHFVGHQRGGFEKVVVVTEELLFISNRTSDIAW
eukprot:343195-Prorocentrum_minimum.AAC.1